MNPDFAIFDDRRATVAIVEVKSKRGTSPDWAARLRRNIVAHVPSDAPRYFVIVTPDTLYVWEGVGDATAVVSPTAVFDSRALLRTSFADASVGPDEVNGRAFELVIADWLARLVRGDVDMTSVPRPLHGFVDALRDCSLQYDIAA